MLEGPGQGTFIREIIIKYIYANLKKTPRLVTRVSFCLVCDKNPIFSIVPLVA